MHGSFSSRDRLGKTRKNTADPKDVLDVTLWSKAPPIKWDSIIWGLSQGLVFENYFHRVIPTLKHYSLFWHSFWHTIWKCTYLFWHSFWHSDILSGISGILCGWGPGNTGNTTWSGARGWWIHHGAKMTQHWGGIHGKYQMHRGWGPSHLAFSCRTEKWLNENSTVYGRYNELVVMVVINQRPVCWGAPSCKLYMCLYIYIYTYGGEPQICIYIYLYSICIYIYTLWQFNIAIENDHRNSGFTH